MNGSGETEAPPAPLANFAIAMEAIQQAPMQVFGVSLDPFKPRDVITPPGFSALAPPRCPTCFTLLHAGLNNEKGDVLFECLYDGYTAVYRRESRRWEPRPISDGKGGFLPSPSDWVAPKFGEKPETATGPVEPLPEPHVPRTPVPPSPAEAHAALVAAGTSAAQWLTLKEAADVTGKSIQDLYKAARSGSLASKKDEKGRVVVDVGPLAEGA